MSDGLAGQAGLVARRVESREWEGVASRVVVAERKYATGIDDLWNALTDPERMKRWFMPVAGDLREGGNYQLTGNASGTIKQCTPPSRLYVTWEMHGGISWVVVTLHAVSDGETRLQLEHIAPESAEGMAFWEQFGPGAVGVGWDLSLLGLAAHAERGESPAEQSEANLLATPEGRAFAEETSAAWGEAAIEFGDSEEEAKAAAGRTFAFYTGSGPQ